MGFADLFRRKTPEQKEAIVALARIHVEKGCYCEEYLDAFKKANPKLTSDDYLTLCEILIEMERYDEAKDCLLRVRPGAIFDDMTEGAHSHCQLALAIETGHFKEACRIFEAERRFLDTFMSNPVRSKVAGDYYSNAAVLCALSGDEESCDRYIRRLREWCDIYPKHPILLKITEVKVLFAQGKQEAEAALADCDQAILDFSGFKFNWEQDYYRKKLSRASRITHEV